MSNWFSFRRSASSKPIVRKARLAIDGLEARDVPAVVNLGGPGEFRTIDGTGNNTANPDWGSANVDLLRQAAPQYADGASAPAGASRPSARAISNAIFAQGDADLLNDRDLSAMVYAWGQFIDHDLDLTMGTSPAQAFNIAVPTGDPYFDPAGTGTQTIPLNRSRFDSATGVTNARQQINGITAWMDGSMVYGSDAATASSLRTFAGGKLKTSDGNLLPTDASGFFQAGDIRANENVELISLQTLFVREHNRLAERIGNADATLSDEQIYQRARALVIGEIQAITYNEWLPTLLGPGAIKPYSGYKPNVNPGVTNEFSTALFRFGHSMVGDDVRFLDNDGNPTAPDLSLAQAFFNPGAIRTNGIDGTLKYLASDPSQQIDAKVVDSLRNFLFGPPGAGGLDLVALNIQRGRDHGLADYNTTRAAYGLPKVTDFSQITKNTDLQARLKEIYGDVNNVDLWVGALAEDHVPGSSVGPLVQAGLADQFTRLRDGDRFWHQNALSGDQLRFVSSTKLADVIRRNTGTNNLQANVFRFDVSISGQVFGDRNANGRRDRGEMGLGGRTVELVDVATGAVALTTQTDAKGNYRFEVADGLELGRFLVREVLPNGTKRTTQPTTVALTRGGQDAIVNLGEAPINALPPPPAPAPMQSASSPSGPQTSAPSGPTNSPPPPQQASSGPKSPAPTGPTAPAPKPGPLGDPLSSPLKPNGGV